MNMLDKIVLLHRYGAKHMKDYNAKDTEREQKVIKLSNDTYQIVWAEDYDKWINYYKDNGKIL
ncbi:MAG: hypothetical protein ACP5TL_01905 [Candidatus Micrarchaeia archaeon]